MTSFFGFFVFLWVFLVVLFVYHILFVASVNTIKTKTGHGQWLTPIITALWEA